MNNDTTVAVLALAEQLDRLANLTGWNPDAGSLAAHVASIVAERDMLRAEIGNVWEALPDDVHGEYTNVSDAVTAVLSRDAGAEYTAGQFRGREQERDRIVTAIDRERREYGPREALTPNGQGYVLALDLAAAIARGDA